MLLKIADLKKGDEVLTTSNGSFRYWKVLEEPKLLAPKPQSPGRGTRYGGVKCSCKMDVVATPGWNGRMYTSKIYTCTPFEHNHIERVSMNYKSMWLVRRNEP